jgi:mannan endo-1,4-beta-mannosidase
MRSLVGWNITRSSAASYVKTIDSGHLVTAGYVLHNLFDQLDDAAFSDAGYYCLSCHKLFAEHTTSPNGLFTGPSFDGSYGVDTEDIMAIGSIDFGSLYV